MDKNEHQRVSKFISLVLRHQPSKIGVAELEPGGYVPVEALLAGLQRHGCRVDRTVLDEVVRENGKQRFSYDQTGTRIRCNQGHSVPVDLGLEPATPPEWLFHGTVAEAVELIRQEGLKKMRRHAVHLSPDVETATIVGRRRGKPIILTIAAGRMHADGFVFYRSDNGVWLVDEVPPTYLVDQELR